MKYFIKITFWFLLLGGIILIIAPILWFPRFYDVRFQGWSMLIGSLIILFIPRLLRVPAAASDSQRKNQAANLLQLLAAIALLADVLGDLGLYTLYQYGFPYSYTLHVVITLISVILLTLIINRRFNLTLTKSALLAFGFVLACGIIWEIFENSSDYLLHTHLAGPDQLTAFNSTEYNLIQDLVGSSLGLMLMELKAKFVRTKVKL